MNFNTHIDTMMRKHRVCVPADIFPVSGGIINQTFEVTGRNHERFIVQRIHPAFNEQTIRDQDAVCRYLERKGFAAPAILTWWEDEEAKLWKVSKRIEHSRDIALDDWSAFLAANHLGRIHESLREFDYEPRPAIKGFHDTPAILKRLEGIVEDAERYCRGKEASFVLEESSQISLPEAPPSIIHGDPKWTNFLFDQSWELFDYPIIGVAALIDWDTIMKGNPFLDIGDMVRSFCKGLDGRFSRDRFKSIVAGYGGNGEFQEKALIAGKVITLELAARFLIDVVEDYYFDFDRSKFTTRRDSNISSAKRYIDYYKSM